MAWPDRPADDGFQGVAASEISDVSRRDRRPHSTADKGCEKLSHPIDVIWLAVSAVLPLQDAWRREIRIESGGRKTLARSTMAGNPKVSQLEASTRAHEDVERGDVAMERASAMQVFEGAQHSDDFTLDLGLGPRAAPLAEPVRQGTVPGQLEYQAEAHPRWFARERDWEGLVDPDDTRVASQELTEVRLAMPAGLVGHDLHADVAGTRAVPPIPPCAEHETEAALPNLFGEHVPVPGERTDEGPTFPEIRRGHVSRAATRIVPRVSPDYLREFPRRRELPGLPRGQEA